jgi:peptidyl-tRNA hydrolase
LRRQDYARLRIGVGPVPPGLDGLSEYVLDPFPREERDVLDQLLDPMAEAVETWVEEGIEMAMTRHNRS